MLNSHNACMHTSYVHRYFVSQKRVVVMVLSLSYPVFHVDKNGHDSLFQASFDVAIPKRDQGSDPEAF